MPALHAFQNIHDALRPALGGRLFAGRRGRLQGGRLLVERFTLLQHPRQ